MQTDQPFTDHDILIRLNVVLHHTTFAAESTWSKLFYEVASITISASAEHSIREQLLEVLRARVGDTEDPTSEDDISQIDFTIVRDHLFARNLIDVEVKSVQVPGTMLGFSQEERYWKLTDYGPASLLSFDLQLKHCTSPSPCLSGDGNTVKANTNGRAGDRAQLHRRRGRPGFPPWRIGHSTRHCRTL